jgi:putative thioredoxin
MFDLSLSQKAKPAAGVFIRDTDAARFEEDVLAVSLKTPVIVDFWAPWCGPCKQMMPALEKTVTEAQGQVHLVKVNVDKNPELAEVFRVQSVPTVFGFFQGQPVDGFMGARSETELRAFVAKLAKLSAAAPPAPENISAEQTAKYLAAADALFYEGKTGEAMGAYSRLLEVLPEHAEAAAGLAWCLFSEGDIEALEEFMSQMTTEQKKHARIQGLHTLLGHAKAAGKLDDEASLAAAIARDPKNLQARYDLALVKIAAADLPGAVDMLVEIARRDREWQQQKARKLLLEVFDAMGPAHPLTGSGRRRLSSVLFS